MLLLWRFAVAVPGSHYFIKRMVLWAIRKAESIPPSGGEFRKASGVASDATG